jgi:hypothetical protein
VAHSSPPALHADDGSALLENTELDRVHDAPLETAVNVLLPWRCLEIGLLFREVEGVYTAVQVRVLPLLATEVQLCARKLTLEAIALRVTMMMGHTGRYLETRRAVVPLEHISIYHIHTAQPLDGATHLVVRTKIAPAFCSRLALTAAMAQVSEVGHGNGASFLSSSKALTYGIATSASKQVSCIMVTASTG